MDIIVGLLAAVLGAAAGGITTYLTTRKTMWLTLEHTYDKALREIRLPHYQQLFSISECIPREWRPTEEPTREDLRRFRQTFHNWYFGDEAGGMFLPEATRRLYFHLQNALEQAAVGTVDPAGSALESTLSADEKAVLYSRASALRHQLTWDLGAAEPPKLPWARVGPTLPPPSADRQTWVKYARAVYHIDAARMSKQEIMTEVYDREGGIAVSRSSVGLS